MEGFGRAGAVALKCRACDGALGLAISLGNQYLPRWIEPSDAEYPRAPLDLMQCDDCHLLQLGNTVDPDLLFREFHYRSGINETMRSALRRVVSDGLQYESKGTWLDIGANDGYLLSTVPEPFRKIACEPALNFMTELEEQSDRVIDDYFTAENVGERCDVITSCAMFYDVDEPMQFVQDIAQILTPAGVWINQLNDAPTMLRQNAFDAICHEHLCYYDVHTLNMMYARAGLKILSITSNDVNGGSIRVIASKTGEPMPLSHFPETSPAEVQRFAQRTIRWKVEMERLLCDMAKRGPIWGYGASTKGHVLLQYLTNSTHASHWLSGIADKNPRKWGKVMPGVGVQITNEDTMRSEKPAYALVLPWAFRKEFVEREAETRAAGTAMVFPLPNIEVVL